MKSFKILLAAAGSAAAMAGLASPAHSQADPYLGQITSYAFDFCPQGWAPAAGQILSVSQYTALFSLYGATYGGDGVTTFALPNLSGRHAAGAGQGPGLDPVMRGQSFGQTSVSLTIDQMPAHNHSFHASSQAPDSPDPEGGSYATYPPQSVAYAEAGLSDVALNPAVIPPAGTGAPIPLRQPYLAMSWCVAMQGLYPSRPD
ncbi:phage tail protein [Alkalicaulis satelles]|nr:tail fiber protein [Alkalicaulis satelles]